MLTKNEIRTNNKMIRSRMPKTEVESKSHTASKLFTESEMYQKARVSMLYIPLGNETDTAYITEKAIADGKRVCFPVTDKESGEITACFADRKTVFEKGAFSVSEPQNSKLADPEKIDAVVVPGIAFDRFGTRVGFGKGCYDRFLKKTDAVRIGYCYENQIVNTIPADKHDVRMDYIISECGIIKIREEL